MKDIDIIDLYFKMLLIRYFEEKVEELFLQGLIHGTTHLYVGEEAVAVGACSQLSPGDMITSTHRGHGHCIAMGADIKRMMAEIMGKSTGYCKGKGGSMHIADVEKGILGANGVVGGGIPLAAGAALTQKLKKTGKVVLCFFGDGASNTGSFHESLNLASIWKLPVVFICEDNCYAVSFSAKKSVGAQHISDRAIGYGIDGGFYDGNDIFSVMKATKEAIDKARSGAGPTLLEFKTYRWKGHSKSDANRYRTKEEIEEWKKRCPIQRLEKELIKQGKFTKEMVSTLKSKTTVVIEEAVEFAGQSPEPLLNTILTGVYT